MVRRAARWWPLAVALTAMILNSPTTSAAGAPARAAVHRTTGFEPGALWLDTRGVPINAHGGGVLYHDGVYFWYGETRLARTQRGVPTLGVSCYSSKDLYNWTNEGIVLPVVEADPDHDLRRGCIIERPKVIFNRATGKFVMWFHLELAGQGYSAARSGVAIADRATGPFRFLESFGPDGEMARDQTLFVDDDGKAYLFAASDDNWTLHLAELSEGYTKTTGRFARLFERRQMEAPAVFKHDGRYWFIGSDCTGWKPNPMRSAVADSIWGPWKEMGNPCIGPNANLSFQTQSTYVLPVAGKPGAFIYMSDRWRPENPIDGRYVWLPIQFTKDRFVIAWRNRWDLDFFGSAEATALSNEVVAVQDWAPAKADSAQSAALRLPPEDLAWWRDAKFGMFIHWGVYSIPGKGEWIMHHEKIPAGEYAQLARQFKASHYDPRKWAQVAIDAGAKYTVLTARHHDGFALWDSAWAEGGFTAMRSAARRDLLAEYVAATRQAGLRVGLYYSPMDWRFPGYFKPRELVRNALIMKAQGYGQVRELMSLYGQIDILWYDGGWLAHQGSDADAAWFWEPIELNSMVRAFQPKAVISPRSGWEGDFLCEEGEGEITGPIRRRPWEKCIRLNTRGWGYTKEETLLSVEQCLIHLVNAITRNGNLLLNVGPDPDGVIPESQAARMKEIGNWLRVNGEAVFGTRPGPFQPVDRVYGSTFRGRRVYMHVMDWPNGTSLRLPTIAQRVIKAQLLDGSAVEHRQSDSELVLSLPIERRQPIVTIIELELDAPATDPLAG